MLKRSTELWSSNFPRLFSWPISIAESAKRTSARRLRRRSVSRRRNGSKIRCAGISRFILMTKQRWSVEAAEMFLSGKALRSAYRVIARDGHADLVSLRSQNDSSPRRQVRGSFTGLHSTSRISSRRKKNCRRNGTSSPRSSTRWERWSLCWTVRAGSCASIVPANS